MRILIDLIIIVVLSYSMHYFSGQDLYFSFLFIGVFMLVGKVANIERMITGVINE